MARRKTITKEQILNAAYALVASEGFSKFTARNVAYKMKCSTQPIYLEFENMDDLREQVLDRIKKHLVEEVFAKEITGNLLIDLVLNYVQFAREESILYRTLYLEEYINAQELSRFNHDMFMIRLNKDSEFEKLPAWKKENLFMGTWVVATGIATLNASGLFQPSVEEIQKMMGHVNQNLLDFEGVIYSG
ncbi:TetR/AcrR family transcriptional regulator [Vagococcus elongatus]|uniref:TetR family transcriptional regulator n=1 Tax=Vagococcus elongatus TaxID=180344 RepID=A0A430B416_9ENTE|nr:TetR/AcrR family transcriptional regulator [Vagococcus elongatus]RSU15087.1 TetR family transcriptional regulator [Vagococcus elongatus]